MTSPETKSPVHRGPSVNQLLTLLVLAITLPLFAFSGLVLWRYSEQQELAAENLAQSVASELASELEREIHGIKATLSSLATSPALQTGDLGVFEAQARGIAGVMGLPILLWDAKTGFQLVNTRLEPGAALPKDPLLPSARQMIDTKDTYVSDISIGQVTGKPLVYVAVPVFRDSEIAYIVVASIDPSRMTKILESRPGSGNWTTGVVDRAGAIIARSGGRDDIAGHKSILETSGKQEAGVERVVDVTGQMVIQGHKRLAFGWTAVALTPAAFVDGPLRNSWLLFTAVGVFLLGIALPLALFLARRIKIAITLAATNALALERGEIVPVLKTGVGEADDVTRSLHAASLTLRERTRSLAESAARFRSAFDQAAVGFFQQEIDGRWIDVNARFCEILGLTRAECLATSPEDLIHPDDRHIGVLRRESIMRGEASAASYEKRFIARDGSTIWVRATTSLVQDADGYPTSFVTVIEDMTEEQLTAIERTKLAALVEASSDAMLSVSAANIIDACNPSMTRLIAKDRSEILGQTLEHLFPPQTHAELAPHLKDAWHGLAFRYDTTIAHRTGNLIDVALSISPIMDKTGLISGLAVTLEDIRARRRWESQLLLLNRELQHRVKNSLAIVQSIASQTLRSSRNLLDFKPAFEGRLQALAGANDLLLQSRWTGEHLDVLVARQVNPLLASPARHLQTTGEDVMVPADLVVPLSLALHELATNALKHGALTSLTGCISIDWHIDRAEGGRELALNWTESGGPPAPETKRTGFGSLLILRGIPGAKVTHDMTGSGLLCTIRVGLADPPDAAARPELERPELDLSSADVSG